MKHRINLPRRARVTALAALLLIAAAVELSSENVTLTTYYPAPSGVYTQMITTLNTFLARDGGNVIIGPQGPAAAAKLDVRGGVKVRGSLEADGRVGIGGITPRTPLDVNGGIRLGNEAGLCNANIEGTLRYLAAPAARMEFCDGSAWTPLTPAAPTAAASGRLVGCTGGAVAPTLPAGKRILSAVAIPVHDWTNDPHPEAFLGQTAGISANGRVLTIRNLCGSINPWGGNPESIKAILWHVTY